MRTLTCINEVCSGARKVFANLVSRQKSSTKYQPIASKPLEKHQRDLMYCTYMDDVELEWLGEGDVEMHCTPQTELVSMTPIISLGSSMKPWEDGMSSVWVGTYVGWCVL